MLRLCGAGGSPSSAHLSPTAYHKSRRSQINKGVRKAIRLLQQLKGSGAAVTLRVSHAHQGYIRGARLMLAPHCSRHHGAPAGSGSSLAARLASTHSHTGSLVAERRSAVCTTAPHPSATQRPSSSQGCMRPRRQADRTACHQSPHLNGMSRAAGDAVGGAQTPAEYSTDQGSHG